MEQWLVYLLDCLLLYNPTLKTVLDSKLQTLTFKFLIFSFFHFSGEKLRKRDVVSVDRISALPEPLILQILSLLPTNLVIATSVLSKQWRYIWKMVSVLQFEFKGDIHKFAENFSKSLLSHKAPVLETLHLKLNDRCEDVYIGIWAGIAFTRHVRELELNLHFRRGNPIRLPSSLFCFDTIQTLKLKSFFLLDIPSVVLQRQWIYS